MNVKELSRETDRLGNEVVIYHSETLGMSPAYTFFLRQMALLIESGHAYPATKWDDDRCGVIFAVVNGDQVVGHIVYDRDNPVASGALWITLSAVDETFRGRGIYKMLHKHFEDLAKSLKCWAIASHVHVNNIVRIKSCESVGLKPVFHLMGKRMRD